MSAQNVFTFCCDAFFSPNYCLFFLDLHFRGVQKEAEEEQHEC